MLIILAVRKFLIGNLKKTNWNIRTTSISQVYNPSFAENQINILVYVAALVLTSLPFTTGATIFCLFKTIFHDQIL